MDAQLNLKPQTLPEPHMTYLSGLLSILILETKKDLQFGI